LERLSSSWLGLIRRVKTEIQSDQRERLAAVPGAGVISVLKPLAGLFLSDSSGSTTGQAS
jgi:hypothetical protein